MRRLFLPLLLILALLALAACGRKTISPGVDPHATAQEQELQRELVVKKIAEQQTRLIKVSEPLSKSNVPICRSMGKTSKSLGLYFMHYGYLQDAKDWAQAYQKEAGVHPDALTVFAVTAEGPADKAGVRKGDAVLAVNGQTLDMSSRKAVSTSWGLPWNLAQKGPVTLRLRRDGQEFETTIQPEEICLSLFGLVPLQTVNAIADGKGVQVFQGMMDFAHTDDELALVLGHEMAHNIMGHADTKRGQAALGALFDILLGLGTGVNTGGLGMNAGANAYSKEYEAEADYVGMYFAARAGYDIKTGPEIWRRMAASSPAAMSGGSSHPGSAERFTALAATRAEIERKEAAGQELKPEMAR